MDKIFYSWQSDLPNKINRSFIQNALKKAVKNIKQDDSIKVDPVIDRDTSGVPGSPDIVDTILEKIDSCSVFAGDVSIINATSKKRKTPNPNVLIEFGYALKRLGLSHIILVINEKYGDEKKLPFDLFKKRVIKYNLSDSASDDDRSIQRNSLEKKLTTALRSIFQDIAEQKSKEADIANDKVVILRKNILYESKRIEVDDLIRSEVEIVRRVAEPENEDSLGNYLTQDKLISLINDFESASKNLEQMMVVMGEYAPDFHRHHLIDALESLCNLPLDSRYYYESSKYIRYYPALRVLYVAGISAYYYKNYENLRALLIEPKYRRDSQSEPLIITLNAPSVLKRNKGRELPGMERSNTPISDHLQATLRKGILPIIGSEDEYNRIFDQFEYLIALVEADLRPTNDPCFWAPVGCFGWRESAGYKELADDAEKEKQNWPFFEAGFFKGSYDRFIEAKKKVDEFRGKLNWY
ncbi:hypothetical protein ACFL4V_02150 [Candidatus Latescibacterota bacterium]